MNTTTHEPLSELQNFVAQQAIDDAGLSNSELSHQLSVVEAVLHDSTEDDEANELFSDYSNRVNRNIAA